MTEDEMRDLIVRHSDDDTPTDIDEMVDAALGLSELFEEAADDGCGADFEGFEGGPVKGGGHRCLSAGDVGREGCYGGRREGGKRMRGSKKILARLRAARASLARIFLLVKAHGRERGAG